LPQSLLNKDYTGIIKVFDNNNIKLEIKIYEGHYIKITDYIKNINCYIEDDKIPLEIRKYNNFNKTDVKYIYDSYIITQNTDFTLDIVYRDTMETGNFYLKNIKFTDLSKHQRDIFIKFNNITRETIMRINNHVEDMKFA
jgi:hypothetical protein